MADGRLRSVQCPGRSPTPVVSQTDALRCIGRGSQLVTLYTQLSTLTGCSGNRGHSNIFKRGPYVTSWGRAHSPCIAWLAGLLRAVRLHYFTIIYFTIIATKPAIPTGSAAAAITAGSAHARPRKSS